MLGSMLVVEEPRIVSGMKQRKVVLALGFLKFENGIFGRYRRGCLRL
jgi:hypothetical protein